MIGLSTEPDITRSNKRKKNEVEGLVWIIDCLNISKLFGLRRFSYTFNYRLFLLDLHSQLFFNQKI